MSFSINTNSSATLALRSLAATTTELDKVQKQVSTGFRVSSAQDNASVFAVAQGVRASIRGYDAANNALSGGKGTLSVAITGATSVSNILGNVREKLTQLSDESLSTEQRTIYTNDLRQQFGYIRNFIEKAEFNGRNLLSGNQGSFNDAFTGYSNASDVRIIQDLSGNTLAIRANDLYRGAGGTSGTTGFAAFSRLVYATATTAQTEGQVAADTAFTNAVGVNTNNAFVARSVISSRIAQAALADLTTGGTRSTDAFYTSSAATAGSDSVFNSAFGLFQNEVNLALGQLGSDSKALTFQIDFNNSIRDATEEGLGGLVDADLVRQSAKLQALQSKQQLALQSLSIANQSPTILINLFR